MPSTRSPKAEDVKLRFLPDTPEQICQSIARCGYKDRLEKEVRAAIARGKRR